MNRKTRFFFGLLLVVLIFALPLAVLSLARAHLYLSVSFAAFVISICIVYTVTMKNMKRKHPLGRPRDALTPTVGACLALSMKTWNGIHGFFVKKRKKMDMKKTKKKR